MTVINYDLIEETLKEIKNIRLFSSSATRLEDVIEYNDFEECFEMAFDDAPYELDGEEWTWGELKEKAMEPVREEVYKHENYPEISRELMKIGITNFNQLLISDECGEIVDEIYSDLRDCIKCRAILGTTNTFIEKMLQIYLSGGWPCGWEGEFPQGKFKVYYKK